MCGITYVCTLGEQEAVKHRGGRVGRETIERIQEVEGWYWEKSESWREDNKKSSKLAHR